MGTRRRTSTELNEPSDNDEYESEQLGVGEHILDTHRHLNIDCVDCRQNNCNIDILIIISSYC